MACDTLQEMSCCGQGQRNRLFRRFGGRIRCVNTLNVYCHQFQNAQARVAEAMDGAFGFLDSRKMEA